MEDERKVLEDFLSFTGCENEEKATRYLKASDWNLPDAVQLFFTEQTTDEPEPSRETESVRAPIPSKFERIIDYAEGFEQKMRNREKQKPIYEAFRNHSAELAEYEQGPNAPEQTTGLAKLYKAPIDLLFRGNFEEAKEVAMKKNLWLMVNIQSAEEFASHQLNSDTFSNDSLKEIIKANFIFFQTYTNGVTGERLKMMYQVQKCPCVLIIDPITGGLMKAFYGFVEAERLIDQLVQYMDCSPDDEAGATQIQRRQKARVEAAERDKSSQKTVITKEIQDALAIAIENSKKRKSEKGSEGQVIEGKDEGSSQFSESNLAREAEKDDSKDVKVQDDVTHNNTKPRMPVVSPIPETTGDDTCFIGILLPDGKRLQRCFYKTDRIESLYGFCNSEFPEGENKAYKLIPRLPGSKPIADWEMSIEKSEIAGTMLALIWD